MIDATPVSSKLGEEAAKVTADLDTLNQTIRNFTQHQDFFPDVELNDDVELFIAVLLLLVGLFCGVVGAQYAKVVFVIMSFLAGIVISMYPIDALMGSHTAITPISIHQRIQVHTPPHPHNHLHSSIRSLQVGNSHGEGN